MRTIEERIITSDIRYEDFDTEPKLRPNTLDSYIGQETVKNNMRVFIQAAKEMGLPVKINTVNRKELNPISLVLYAQQEKIPIRFIEMMPVGYGKQYVGRSNDELRACLEDEFGKSEMITYQANQKEQISHMVQTLHTKEVPMGSGPAVYYKFSKLTIPVGFISAIHGKFCESCNRVRLTAQGYLKLCLCYDKGIDLRQILRGEEVLQNEKNIQKALNEKLTTAMRAAIYKKPAAHCFEHPEEMTEINEMVKIGG